MVVEGPRTPPWTWLLVAGGLVLVVGSVALRSRTSEVTWYESGLMLGALALVVWAFALRMPAIVHRLRPSSYEHKSTTGERVALGGLWVVLGGVLLTFVTGPVWATFLLGAAAVTGLVLLNQRQKRRIHGPAGGAG
jgi:hypothetical protein